MKKHRWKKQNLNQIQGNSKNKYINSFITMDHMGFGMGNCALQMTFLSIDIDHARFLYDQFAILSPLFLALSAGSPIFKGLFTIYYYFRQTC